MRRKRITKNDIAHGIILLIYAIAFIVFVISLFNNLAWGVYICGVIIIVCLLASIIHPLLYKQRISVFGWIEILIDFLATLIILIPYISSISDDNLRNTVIAIASSAIGGFLTLFGVGLTLKYTRIANEEDYLKKIKPFIFTISPETWKSLPEDRKITAPIEVMETSSSFKRAKKKSKNNYCFAYILLGCSDVSMCLLSAIIINENKFIKFDHEKVLLKNSYNMIIIDYSFECSDKIDSIGFVLEDIVHNVYEADVRFTIDKDKVIVIESVFDPRKSNIYFE